MVTKINLPASPLKEHTTTELVLNRLTNYQAQSGTKAMFQFLWQRLHRGIGEMRNERRKDGGTWVRRWGKREGVLWHHATPPPLTWKILQERKGLVTQELVLWILQLLLLHMWCGSGLVCGKQQAKLVSVFSVGAHKERQDMTVQWINNTGKQQYDIF